MGKGRPPVTRARVLNYIEKHRPATIMQVVRATGVDRAHVYRILWATYGHNFRSEWGLSANMGKSATRAADMHLAA